MYIIKYLNMYNNLTVNTSEAKYDISICLIEHRKELREREREREKKRKRKRIEE